MLPLTSFRQERVDLYLSRKKWGKARSRSSPRVQYGGMRLTYFSSLFPTGWPAWITALGTWSKDPDWCVFSTTWLLEENKYFSEGLSSQSSTQVRQTELPTLRLCWALRIPRWPQERIFFPSFGSRAALSPLPAMPVGVKPYIVFTAWGTFFSRNVLSEDRDCSCRWDECRLKVWEEYAEKRKRLHVRY